MRPSKEKNEPPFEGKILKDITESMVRNEIVKLPKATQIDTCGVKYRLFDSAINVKMSLEPVLKSGSCVQSANMVNS